MITNKIHIGNIGEKYISYLLALKGIDVLKLKNFFEYDLITDEGIRIEVKTSTILYEKERKGINKPGYTRPYYLFACRPYREGLLKSFDYYALVCLNKENKPIRYYIVPSSIIGNRKAISIPILKRRPTRYIFDLEKYKNNIDLLIINNKKCNYNSNV